jgi:hypothetical protein
MNAIADALLVMSKLDPAVLTAVNGTFAVLGTGSAGLFATGLALHGIALSIRSLATYGPGAIGVLTALGLISAVGAQRSKTQVLRDEARQLLTEPDDVRDARIAEILRERKPKGLGPFFSGMWQQLFGAEAPAAPQKPPEATVTIRIDGPGRVTGVESEGMRVRTGESMSDTIAGVP